MVTPAAQYMHDRGTMNQLADPDFRRVNLDLAANVFDHLELFRTDAAFGLCDQDADANGCFSLIGVLTEFTDGGEHVDAHHVEVFDELITSVIILLAQRRFIERSEQLVRVERLSGTFALAGVDRLISGADQCTDIDDASGEVFVVKPSDLCFERFAQRTEHVCERGHVVMVVCVFGFLGWIFLR